MTIPYDGRPNQTGEDLPAHGGTFRTSQARGRIFRITEPQLRLFVFGSVSYPAAEDVLQEVLKAVATGLISFQGNTTGEFWKWCYRIARRKRCDQIRKEVGNRFQRMPPEELWDLVDASAHVAPISAADKHDLDYALKLLTASKPECYDYFGTITSSVWTMLRLLRTKN